MLPLIALAGCGQSPAPKNLGTGSREATREFYDAIVKQDWKRGYDALDADSKKRATPAQFAELAAAYRKNVGFVPEEFRIQTCDEKGDSAIARVVLTGHAGDKMKRYTDGVPLRKVGESWHVVLPAAFGRKLP